jgi:chromosome segregation ATPase
MAMSTMKDSERIELLKEIGGTKVYEERCAESLKLMKETETRRQQIEEVVRGAAPGLGLPPLLDRPPPPSVATAP